MLHRGIKFVHVAVLVFSAFLSFLFVRGLDEKLVLGSSAQIWVSGSGDKVNSVQVFRTIESVAADHGVTVARELPDVKDPDGMRHLYLTSGGSQTDAASWLSDGYPGFSRHIDTNVHPMAEIGPRDPRGFYYVFGAPEAADALVAELARLGLSGSVRHPLAHSELAVLFSGDDLSWSLCVVALAAVTMTGASVLLSAKKYGVQRLQGGSFLGLLADDLKRLAVFWSIAAGTVTAAVLILLCLYNGLAWLGLFAWVAALFAGLLVLLVLATHAAALALTFRVEVLRALKGELPARAAFCATYLVRIPAVLLALGFAMDVTLAGQNVLARQENWDAYAKAGDAVTIRLNGSWGGDSKPVVKQVGQWLRQADAAGEIIVAGRQDLQGFSSVRLPQSEMLIVNETFLAEQPVLDPKGRRYFPVPRSGSRIPSVRLVIPESFTSHAAVFGAAVPDALGRLDPEVRRNLKVETLQAKNGQRIFGYNSGRLGPSSSTPLADDRSVVRDPVLLVVPNGSRVLTDDAYTTFATQEGIIFPDPGRVLKDFVANKNALQTYVAAVQPVAQNAASEVREAAEEFRLQLFNLMATVAVLLITGVGVCIIHARRHAQAVFVRHISGSRFISSHRVILAVEGLLAAFLAWWVPVQAWQQNQHLKELAAQGVPAPFPPVHITALDLSAIAGLVVIEFGAVLLALGMFHRLIVKEGAAEA
ncbi:hypothetical protein [Streptomyces aureoverticillatus]|uniref:hypothetical protein n=1 Tax=Streptomyces aureoverticillatus TaxID=66871 RepID=UPI0013D99946|nr:hypothetical protein [Streptomyces aureoverticillatus]QIB42662.1 hypothetical protein G3H79_05860 [Streptomyces aureoverticillatus]